MQSPALAITATRRTGDGMHNPSEAVYFTGATGKGRRRRLRRKLGSPEPTPMDAYGGAKARSLGTERANFFTITNPIGEHNTHIVLSTP